MSNDVCEASLGPTGGPYSFSYILSAGEIASTIGSFPSGIFCLDIGSIICQIGLKSGRESPSGRLESATSLSEWGVSVEGRLTGDEVVVLIKFNVDELLKSGTVVLGNVDSSGWGTRISGSGKSILISGKASGSLTGGKIGGSVTSITGISGITDVGRSVLNVAGSTFIGISIGLGSLLTLVDISCFFVTFDLAILDEGTIGTPPGCLDTVGAVVMSRGLAEVLFGVSTFLILFGAKAKGLGFCDRNQLIKFVSFWKILCCSDFFGDIFDKSFWIRGLSLFEFFGSI